MALPRDLAECLMPQNSSTTTPRCVSVTSGLWVRLRQGLPLPAPRIPPALLLPTLERLEIRIPKGPQACPCTTTPLRHTGCNTLSGWKQRGLILLPFLGAAELGLTGLKLGSPGNTLCAACCPPPEGAWR